MNTVIIGNPPKNKLPRAKGHDEWKNVYKFGKRDMPKEVAEDKYHTGISGILKQAVLHPGDRVVRYCEENGYEYETYAIYDPVANIITSNYFGCPRSSSHHLGSTCGCCGQEG
jgi:hypothetical protein